MLLTATILSPLPYSPLAVLLLMMLLITMRPQPPGRNVAITVIIIFLTPLVLAPLLGLILPPTPVRIFSAVLIFPVIYLLDHNLRQQARRLPTFIRERKGQHTTYTYISLFVSSLVLMLLSPVLNNPALLITGAAFVMYLLGVLIAILLTIPRRPLTTPIARKRIVAGTTGSIPVTITSRASVSLHGLINAADSWVKAMPRELTLNRGKTRLELSLTPPLAGQARPQLRISAIDPRGFVQINQVLEPVQLHVIPRAKYAEWLARKYLKQTGSGVVTAAVPNQAVITPKRGTEYMDSRTYLPGDQLKDIDWKHTLKLSQLIVKEYTETNGQAAIIAVNLSVTDAGEADKLAFNLITTALTLAREGVPTALAAYNHQRAIISTAITDPTKMLRQALSLVAEITLVKLEDRRLERSDIAKIRRNIAQLKQAESEPAQRLLGMLNFEYRALEEAARNHPATTALSAVTRHSPAPAMILLVSQLNHDAEAILVTAEKLSRRRFTTIPVANTI